MTRPNLALWIVLPIALGVWVLNDHVLKEMFASWWTGKLSDVAGLIAFPLLPVAALELWSRRTSDALAIAAVVVTGMALAAIKTLDSAAWLYVHGLGAAQWPFYALAALARGAAMPGLHTVRLAMDPTDLFTLPALIVPLAVQRCARANGSARLSGLAFARM